MNNLNFLLVDDDLDDQEIFQLALSEVDPDITCAFANDGILGINYLRQNEFRLPDFIFLDLNMPRMGGMEFLKELKKIDAFSHIPVIIYSTSAEPLFMKQTQDLGASGYIVKPSTLRALIQSLDIFVKEATDVAN